MPATVTLSTTSLAAPCAVNDTQILPASLTGVVPGVCLYVDRELLQVVDPALPGGWVKVLRGRFGTATSPHGTNSVVTIARPDQFYDLDPVGAPPVAVPVQPWINLRNGNIWVPQGDEEGPGINARYWRLITTTYAILGLGYRSNTTNPSYSGVST